MKKLVRNPKWAAARYEYRFITDPYTTLPLAVQLHPVRGDEIDADGNLIPIPEFIEVDV